MLASAGQVTLKLGFLSVFAVLEDLSLMILVHEGFQLFSFLEKVEFILCFFRAALHSNFRINDCYTQ